MFQSTQSAAESPSRTTRRVFLATAAAAVAGTFIAVKTMRSAGQESSTQVRGTPGQVTIVDFTDQGVSLGPATVARIVKSDGEWYRQLGRNSFDIARRADTEMPFSGVTVREHAHGLYRCICCNTALFRSDTKFHSGTGWPSFYAPIARENVVERSDTSLGIPRTEVQCARCEAHLGHVFSDGPEPTGLRYCMNSASMRFVKA